MKVTQILDHLFMFDFNFLHRFDQIERESNVERDIAQSFLFYRDSVSVLEHLNRISQETYSA